MSQPKGGEPQIARTKPQPEALQEPQTPPARRRGSLVRELAGILVTALLMSLLIKTFLVQAFFIPSGSMEPVLHGCEGCLGDRVLVNKLTTRMGGVRRGDIVVFHDTAGWISQAHPTRALQSPAQDALAFIGLAPSNSESDLVKRVIGVGGDTVKGLDGNVYVNGARLDEPYVFPGDRPSETTFEVTVPLGKLWVMGDHRSESGDSRFHRQGPGQGFVPVQDVVGRAFVIVWPFDRAGYL